MRSLLVALTLGLAPALVSAAADCGGNPKVYDVTVGEGGLTFKPDKVTAEVGSFVRFTFFPQNHTLTQASFDSPCSPLEGGINSGFIPTKAGDNPKKTFVVEVMDDKPMFFYCAQDAHCQSGMAMAINPSDQNTLDDFVSAAANVENTTPANGITDSAEIKCADRSTPSGSSSSAYASNSSSVETQGANAASFVDVSRFAFAAAFAAFVVRAFA